MTIRKSTPLKNLTINLTDRCNGSCKYCNIWQNFISELSQEQVELICREEAFASVSEISLTGGEIFLFPGIEDTIQLLVKSFNLRTIYLNTNGSIGYDKIEKSLLRIPPHIKCVLSISYDGGKAENLQIRGKDYSQNIIDIAEKCHAAFSNVDICLSMTICKDNCSAVALERLVSFAEEISAAYSFRFADISDLYYHNRTFDVSVSPEQSKVVASFIDEKCNNDFLRVLSAKIKSGKTIIAGEQRHCLAGQLFAYIHSNGYVYSCLYGKVLLGVIGQKITQAKPICPNVCCTDCVVWPMIDYYST